MTWDATTPANSESEKLGDNRIREVKSDIQTGLQTECVFPGPDPVNNPVCRAKILKGATADRPSAVAAYEGRWYYNTDTKTIQRIDSSPAWASITAAQNMIPSGSVMIFYQASPPAGWAQITDAGTMDRALRVSSGTGGGTGGSDGISAAPSHIHGTPQFTSGGIKGITGTTNLPHTHSYTYSTVSLVTAAPVALAYLTTTPSVTGSADPAHAHYIVFGSYSGFGYIDVCVASKT